MTQDLMRQHSVAPGRERFRPKAHFTPRRNWINDPNGLVFFEGEYHLFYQYNPQGMDWGHMSWGHAVSPDLAHWDELPVAIPETDQMIFSGSIVVDWNNVSGLGDGVSPPLLAFFTAFDAARNIQSQHLAYSHDRGRTFAHYAHNPVIDLDHPNFRDPKVFYHAQTSAWIMVVALAKDHLVQFYRSANLRDWQLSGTFGPAGSIAGQWECPDLILVPIEGEAEGAAWVLKVDVDNDFLGGGSGTQYFVGAFDGNRFALDGQGRSDGDLVDLGPDFYAAITWAELPADRPGPIWIGWQSNHQSGRLYPTAPWRGAMSLPRRLFLYRDGGLLRMAQEPILPKPVPAPADIDEPVQLGAEPVRIVEEPDAFECQVEIGCSSDGCARVDLEDSEQRLLRIAIDGADEEIRFERSASPEVASPAFARRTRAALSGQGVRLRILVDGPLVEIFVNGGRLVYTGTIFPTGPVRMMASMAYGRGEMSPPCLATLSRTMFGPEARLPE